MTPLSTKNKKKIRQMKRIENNKKDHIKKVKKGTQRQKERVTKQKNDRHTDRQIDTDPLSDFWHSSSCSNKCGSS